MKSYLYLSALAALTLASCSDNEVIEAIQTPTGNTDGRISFVQRTENSTRAAIHAEEANHYEFGVNAYLGTVGSTNTMPNFLVGYASSTSGKNWYSDRANISNAQTWGDAGSGDLTDASNNVSSWVYEMMGRTELTATNSTMEKQSLKYWDESFGQHIFVAYTPYLGNANNATPMSSFTVTANTADNKKADVEFTNLSSFYTSPETQISTARTLGLKASATPYNASTSIANNDNELLNANEALYAYNNVSRGDYGKDVPLTFKHVNAKVNIRFYETIKGYKVQILDVVPSTAVAKNSNLSVKSGIQFSPSTDNQSRQPMTRKQTTALPTYHETATVDITDISADSPELALSGNNGVKTNLIFKKTTGNIAEAGGASASLSPTTLYVLPNCKGTNYITNSYSTTYEDYNGAGTSTSSSKVGDVTGYTLHVSYKLIPEDGTTELEVYDARVHVDAQYCCWEAGKAYTYIFKITDQSNGTTDPGKIDPATEGDTNEPWIDPEDPRVPDEPALKPIVFDGVLVTNYDETPTGKTDATDEWVITDPSSWASIGSTAWRHSPAMLNKAQLTEALGSAWVLDYTNLATTTPVTFNGTTRIFTVTDKESTPNTFTWPATVAEEVTAPASTYKSSSISDGPAKVTAYSIYMWTNASTYAATKYTATPTAVDYQKKTVTTTYRKSTQTYVKTEVDSDPATWTLNGAAWTPDGTEASLTPANGWASETKTDYTEPTITYGSVTPTTGSPATAYAIVKAN